MGYAVTLRGNGIPGQFEIPSRSAQFGDLFR